MAVYRLKLVLADYDNNYVDRVTGFINSSFFSGIRVSSFTDPVRLAEYLSCASEKAGILLAHPDFVSRIPDPERHFEAVFILSDGRLPENSDRSVVNQETYRSIYKFQPGDRLIGQIVQIYAEKNAPAAECVPRASATQLIAVFSPAGGVGRRLWPLLPD